MLGPNKIFHQFRSVIKHIEQKNSPARWSTAYHINIIAEGFVIVCCVYWGVSITLNIVVNANFFIANKLFEILPVPPRICWPLFCKIFQYNWFLRNEKLIPEYLRLNIFKCWY